MFASNINNTDNCTTGVLFVKYQEVERCGSPAGGSALHAPNALNDKSASFSGQVHPSC